MADGYTVQPEELRKHAANLDALRARFAAVKSASTHITQDHQAYGLLCGWIAAVLEGRHREQDSLLDFAASNLDLAAKGLRDSAARYEETDTGASGTLKAIGNELGKPAR
ncbi:type VII secretion target [Amycolatopsis plumensis]|uniref:Type VII secretion target n=1 Tax=Amycolatopsis plumensis TaxID=236508 RepID=A0ABV5U9U4_9PSEU